jgi:membrane associated rhomboid family serine protease
VLIPISDDNPTYSRPYVNYGLIVINVAIFLLVLTSGSQEEVWLRYGMKPEDLASEPFTLITSMFLHGGFLHLLGNMWFLWIVGDNVGDALGHGWYLGAYLAGGVAADLIHAAFAGGTMLSVPTIGASGAISAVMGFYVVVFPHNRIRVFYWLFWYIIGTFWARAFWVIGAWFAIQLLWAVVSVGAQDVTGVAYWAHVGGFVFGAGMAAALRALWPSVDPHRRHGRERVAAGPVRAWSGRPLVEPAVTLGPSRSLEAGPVAGPVPVATAGFAGSSSLAAPEEMALAIEQRLAAGDVLGAQRALSAFLQAYPRAPLDVGLQLGLVQALERTGYHASAAECLEHFLATHPSDVNAAEAKLALGMIYSRHLRRLDRARVLLGAAAVQHPVPARSALAQRELAALG